MADAIELTPKESIALMIYESDLVMSSDPEIWDYCLELAGRILTELDKKEVNHE